MEIERANDKLTKLEQKELLVFLLVAFGIPFLMGIPLAILSHAGKDTFSFPAAQMFCPAAGFMLSKLICDKDKSLMPQTFFIGFLVVTGIMILWCFAPFFLPNQTKVISNFLIAAVSIIIGILLLREDDKKRSAYGLKSKNWNLSIPLLILFVALYFARLLLLNIATGSLAELLGSISSSHLLSIFVVLPISFFFNLANMLGEEYGWRCYFQPLLQKKFGLIKGVFAFGVLWTVWHLPLMIFSYAPIESDVVSTTMLAQYLYLLMGLINTTMLGIFMAYVYMRTHNIWLPVLIHFVNNSLSGFGAITQEYTWTMLGTLALIQMVLFLPFLFSKVFRKQVTTQDNVTQI